MATGPYEEANLRVSLAHAAAITALVEATAGIIRLTTPNWLG